MDFKVQGEAQITMYDYIKKLIKSLLDDMRGSKQTSAPEYLFCINDEETIKLSTELSDLFQKVTVQVLWVSSKRGGSNVQLRTAFLCTRVQYPGEHDYKKLQHQMMYLQDTAFLPINLKADEK